ncbi:MAG TPA: PQQ-binding-like beta-propeller repeat protein [Vicinamibacteria bacterium]|nr:PQQ-binding-like beta-propeller repeat protein [Vicinamibacteria bacterium]
MVFLLILLLADWPQFLGPERNGTYDGPPIRGDAPKLVWQTGVGAGFAGPVVVGERLIVFHRKEDREIVEALERKTGESVWRHDYSTSYRDDFGFDEGPRSVPVVAKGVVYTFGAQGVLSAVELETGRALWSVDTRKRFRVVKGFFGAAGSPVVEDGRLLLNVGGRDAGLAAFDAATGEVLWTAGKDEASYSSPVMASFAGKTLALFFTRDGLVAVDPATGEEKHRLQWHSRSRASVNAASPLVVGDVVFLSASYGTGAIALAVESGGLETLWSGDESLSNHYATSVHRDGILYGFHGRQEYTQSFRAVELRTGKVRWSEDGFGAGTVTLAGDRLVIVHESGELIIARAESDSFRPISRAQLIPGVIRAYPALSDAILYVRNSGTLAAFDLDDGR